MSLPLTTPHADPVAIVDDLYVSKCTRQFVARYRCGVWMCLYLDVNVSDRGSRHPSTPRSVCFRDPLVLGVYMWMWAKTENSFEGPSSLILFPQGLGVVSRQTTVPGLFVCTETENRPGTGSICEIRFIPSQDHGVRGFTLKAYHSE